MRWAVLVSRHITELIHTFLVLKKKNIVITELLIAALFYSVSMPKYFWCSQQMVSKRICSSSISSPCKESTTN